MLFLVYHYQCLYRLFFSLQSCLKRIEGAAFLSREELEKRGFINSYIWAMIDGEDDLKVKAGNKACLSCGYGMTPHGGRRCGCKPVLTC
jgi:hypothetical protein